MKTLTSLIACFFLAFSVGFSQSNFCLQDQYGNQYNFTMSASDGFLYGNVTNVQGCPGETWPLLGSFASTTGGTALELTASNPLGSSSSCSPAYMLKGVLPNFVWYYPNSASGQPGQWTACGTAISSKPEGRGALR